MKLFAGQAPPTYTKIMNVLAKRKWNYLYFASGYKVFFMSRTKNRSDCPVSCSLDVWGDKWSLLIVRDLMFAKECTYGDFLKSDEEISTNILADRLKSLEESKIIKKSAHPESKAKVLYKLTEKGIELLPIMIEINLWAEKYFSHLRRQKSNAKKSEKE